MNDGDETLMETRELRVRRVNQEFQVSVAEWVQDGQAQVPTEGWTNWKTLEPFDTVEMAQTVAGDNAHGWKWVLTTHGKYFVVDLRDGCVNRQGRVP